MSKVDFTCPVCGHKISFYHNPVPTVDVIIEMPHERVVLIKRKNPPYGWALPGGFVDYAESVESAAKREAQEETGLQVHLKALLGVFSDPQRDPRQHTISTVFVATPLKPEDLKAGDDASEVGLFKICNWPELVFDHSEILKNYVRDFYKNKNSRKP